MSRTIEIFRDEKFTDAVGKAKAHEVNKAVGYLSMWAVGSDKYYRVKIMLDNHGDMTASYYDKDGGLTYTIGAILRTDDHTYSFHS